MHSQMKMLRPGLAWPGGMPTFEVGEGFDSSPGSHGLDAHKIPEARQRRGANDHECVRDSYPNADESW